MPTTEKAAPVATGVSAGLSILALLFWALTLATLSDLAGSDAAGNAYAQGYGAIEIIFLWTLLCGLTVIAFTKGAMPKPAALAAFVLVPASGIVTMAALDLLSRPEVTPFLWPIVIPALVPPLVVAFSFWALLPALRAIVPARLAGSIVWGGVLILCVSIAPLQQMRERADDKVAAALEKYNADLAKVPADAPLWDWVPFFDTRNESQKEDILAHIRKLARRQNDAELMLYRGDFPLGYLGRLDLAPTPTLCGKARALLRKRVESLVLKTPNAKPYREIAVQVSDALAAMKWLVGYDCSVDAESRAWETMAKAYRDTNFDVHELAELRDPKNLGGILNKFPERFSMLTPKAHLSAWLGFADKKEYHDRALAGARKLDHRTADAVEMINADEYTAWTALKYLPKLDLEATPALCQASLRVLHKQLAIILRPKADDPRPYSELLERLGTGDQFGDLIWLASHGCDADAGLTEAEDLIRTYQDSPQRTAMLANLAKLHRKP